MNTVMKKTQWMCTGLLVALGSGTPALADDTEILLINPNQANPPQPNVLFIIDTSGSMGDEVETTEQYDTAVTYSNANAGCDADRLYWTVTGTVPTCVVGNTQYFEKTSFLCDASTLLLTEIGSFNSSAMVQHRGDGNGGFSWQALAAGDDTNSVECFKDDGDHGATTGSSDVFAMKGTSATAAPKYTANKAQKVEWLGSDVTSGANLYDGNYLNYLATPVLVDREKIDIVKDVVKTVMRAVEDVNVGVMRFNETEGGPVIQSIVDLDLNRTAIINTIDGLDADGWTPLSETLYESARYWRGMTADYGEGISEHTTDPAALRQASPEAYQQPAMASCTKNFNVLLTDGIPTEDLGTPGLVGAMPNWSTALGGRIGCTGTGEGDCLDDVAEYLFKEDINSTLDGDQVVTTHTIGFDIDLDIMEDTALASGGEYFLADDVQSLTIALLKIVSLVQDRAVSFTAPSVAVNSFNRTQNLNDLYLTTFGARGKVHWPGNLKKYEIRGGGIVDANGADAVDITTGFFDAGAQSIWSAGTDGIVVESGGAANELPTPANRELYTYNGTSANLTDGANEISTGNSAAFTQADFGLTGAALEPTVDEIILWARGTDLADEDGDGDITEARNQMGDPLHSQPAAVVYGGSAANPDTVIYTATNDGYLHAIRGSDGQELWSFVPKEHLASFAELYFNLDTRTKNYGIDGDVIPVIKDVDGDGIIEPSDNDFVYLIFGMRRGGSNYYALDVTNKTQPKLLWQFSDPNVGQSWSPPTVARVNMAAGAGQNADQAVVVFGAGYDSAHDTLAHPLTDDGQGAGIFFLDLVTGAKLWSASANGASQLTLADNLLGGAMVRAIPSAVRPFDLNGDGFADRMYASDMGGQVWRFDIHGGKLPNGTGTDALVTGGVIAQLGAEGNLPATNADTRRFYNAPDVSLFTDAVQNRRFIALSIGSGYRAHPLDNTPSERFYSIRDKAVFSQMSQAQYNALTPITESDLVEISGSIGAVVDSTKDGWMFTLPATQKVLAESTTFNDQVFFVAFSPDPDNAGGDVCAAGFGANFLYRVSIVNGDPIADLDNVVSGTEDSLRVTNLAQGGIAASPRFLFPSPDNNCPTGQDCSQPPLGCVGVECFDPDFANNPVRTLWTQDGIE